MTGWLGALYPEQVAGIHMIHPPFPATFDARPLSAAEQAYLDAEAAYDETDGGYSAIMGTRPDTRGGTCRLAGRAGRLAGRQVPGLERQPGDLANSIDRDTLLTIITLYWVTGTIGSSFRQYADFGHNSPRPMIDVPAAFTVSTEPSQTNFPRSIAERACTDIRHWSEPGRGGHFMPLEEPDLLANEMRRFFSSLRTS
ncbi:hypothetical protein NKG94_28435 [Micromonospora sp. M12]